MKNKINRYVISFLIFSITLFGGLSFIFLKDKVDSWINYYIMFVSGLSIILLFICNLEEFKWKNINKVSLILTSLTIIWIIVCTILGIKLNIEALKGVINFGCLLITGFVISNIKLTKNDKKIILKSIFFSFFICMVIGIYQYFSGVNLIQYSNELYPGILGRINSTFFIATILDKYIVIISILLMYTILKNPKNHIYKLLYILAGIGISLTFSRGGQLVFLFVCGVFLIFSIFKKQFLSALSIIITVIVMLLIPGTSLSIQSGLEFVYEKINLPKSLRVDISFINDYTLKIFTNNEKDDRKESGGVSNSANQNTNVGSNDEPIKVPTTPSLPVNQSVSYREKYMNIGKQLIKEYPVFGIGAGNYSYLYNNQNFKAYLKDTSVLKGLWKAMYPHSGYIQTAAEIGYIGLVLLFITLLSYTFYIDYKKEKLVAFTCFMLLIALMLAAYTEGVFHSKQYIFIFYIIFAFLCSKNKKDEQREKKVLELFNKAHKENKDDYFTELEKSLINEEKKFIVTANPEAFMLAEKDNKYLDMLLDDNTKIVADGIGLVKAGQMLNYDIKERIPGVEIAEKLFEYSNKYKKSVYLFGSKPEVIEKMKELFKEKYPKAKLVGAKNGYVDDKDKVFKDIIKKTPDVILVALGMPQQEQLIYKYLNKFNKGIFVGVGGSFDVLSGSKKRAPKLFIKLNLEWLYRIIKEPKRLKRFYDNNIKFMMKIKSIKNES